ncbi:hypothetical protein FOCC_FOCC006666, partial [Frankliniella occidentalis]
MAGGNIYAQQRDSERDGDEKRIHGLYNAYEQQQKKKRRLASGPAGPGKKGRPDQKDGAKDKPIINVAVVSG